MRALVWYVAIMFALDILLYLLRGMVKLGKNGKTEK